MLPPGTLLAVNRHLVVFKRPHEVWSTEQNTWTFIVLPGGSKLQPADAKSLSVDGRRGLLEPLTGCQAPWLFVLLLTRRSVEFCKDERRSFAALRGKDCPWAPFVLLQPCIGDLVIISDVSLRHSSNTA